MKWLPLKERTCRICQHYKARSYCQRNPPARVSDRRDGVWPEVDSRDKCGEWELAECAKPSCTKKRLPGHNYSDGFCKKHKAEYEAENPVVLET